MLKFLKSPEKLFTIAMWIVSFVLAGFLTGLGNKILAELPRVDRGVQIEEFTDRDALSRRRDEAERLRQELRQLGEQEVEAQARLEQRSTAYNAAQQTHRTWLATRTATASSTQASEQDPELLRRSAELDKLMAESRTAQLALEGIQNNKRAAEARTRVVQQEIERQMRDALPLYGKAQSWRELKVFGARLALTLPLLGLAIWLVTKKRKSAYWPLARGFVMFAVFAFFVELVPYLPSYGGVVRQVVGIALCIAFVRYGVTWMRGYLARRQEAQQRHEAERRATLDNVVAMQKLAAQMCPGCDRHLPAVSPDVEVNHCVYCGLALFDRCDNDVPQVEGGTRRCGVRHSTFAHFCPTCGGPTAPATLLPNTASS